MTDELLEIMADAEASIISAEATSFTLNAIKVGTVAHTRDGKPVEFDAETLERIAPSFEGGYIKYNHKNMGQGKITASTWQHPFVVMTIDGLCDKVHASIEADEHTGFSIDAKGTPGNTDTYVGEGISILWGSHSPACPVDSGCGIIGENMPEETNIAEIVAAQLQIDTLTSKLEETETMLAEKTTVAESLFTQEQMDAANTAAIEASDKTNVTITEAKTAVAGMFTKGMEETFEAEVMDLIEAEDYHAVVLKLGTVDFKTIEASIPTDGTITEDKKIEASKTQVALDAALEKLNSKYIGA